MVNAERYQYTKGPNDAVGLKLLMHRQDDVPSVQDFALNIPVGMHTYVAVDLSRVSLLSRGTSTMVPCLINCVGPTWGLMCGTIRMRRIGAWKK